ncbi:uncharacterized protein LOC114280987 [Camellia sinensis]|uniref:uncharacterized protein LOC114280987 n=1 Tax=Camellia sinensis TaxID=4442 RepID=UPI001036F25E|nr:uncharacterized protein LOC114280987 [Camellia sinensis]
MLQAYAPRDEQVEQRPTGRVYTVTAPDLVLAPSMVRDTFLLCNSIANVLIDTGSSHSIISSVFALALGLELAWLASPLSVESPVGGEIVLKQGCRGRDIEVAGRRLPFSFVLIGMSSFDSVLGDKTDRALSPMYDAYGGSELSCLLANVLGNKCDEVRVELLRVVCEYPDVFPKDLTSLPPHREIEFSIDIVPGMALIFMAPYRFEPTELSELKIQV